MAKLHAAIVAFFRRDLIEGELLVPWSAQHLRGEIFQHCEVLEARATEKGSFLRARATQKLLAHLRQQLGAP